MPTNATSPVYYVNNLAVTGQANPTTVLVTETRDTYEATHVTAVDDLGEYVVYAKHQWESAYGMTLAQARARRDQLPGWGLLVDRHGSDDESNWEPICLYSGGDAQWNYGSSGTFRYTAPTCENPGTQEFDCLVCGWHDTVKLASALGHSWGAWSYGSWVVDTAATCSVTGSRHRSKTRTCQRDSSHTQSGTDTETIPIDSSAHSWGAWSVYDYGQWAVDTAATCTATGSRHRTVTYVQSCLNGCGNVQYDTDTETESIPATGHSPASSWSTNSSGHWHACNNGCGTQLDYAAHTPGTPTVENGYRVTRCSVCSYEMSSVAVTPAVGDYVDASPVAEGYIEAYSNGLCLVGEQVLGTVLQAAQITHAFKIQSGNRYFYAPAAKLSGTTSYVDYTLIQGPYQWISTNGETMYYGSLVAYGGYWYLVFDMVPDVTSSYAFPASTPAAAKSGLLAGATQFIIPPRTIPNYDVDSSRAFYYRGTANYIDCVAVS